tara:strand:+ start:869 stop:1489 length:621 start_codon:yes stop_codon:yes gene_type:complete
MIYNMKDIDNRPIVIFTNYRTGSTALCEAISYKLGYKNFAEAFHTVPSTGNLKGITAYIEGKHQNYVFKVMPNQYTKHREQIDDISHGCYCIRLQREDVASQIASLYVARASKQWHQTKYNPCSTQPIKIDPIMMKKCCTETLIMNDYVRKMENFDLELTTEQLGAIKNPTYEVRDKPENYDEILELARDMIAHPEKLGVTSSQLR